MKLALLLAAACLCDAQAPIAMPRIGKMLDASGSLWPLYGVAGNFTVGPREAARVISAACSANLCLAKTAHRILGPRQRSVAPPGPALFGIDGEEALLYFPESGIFARWRQGRLVPLDWHVEGEVLALRAADRSIAVRRGADVWIVRPDGVILDYLGEVTGPVLLIEDAIVLVSADALLLRHASGDEVHFELPGIVGLSALGPEYVQVNTPAASYALRTTPGREDLLLLPAPRGRSR